MSVTAATWARDPRLVRAHGHAQRAEVLQAELLYRALLREHPDCVPAARAVATFAVDRGDLQAAQEHVFAALRHAPNDAELRLDHAQLLWRLGSADTARASLESLVADVPTHHLAWLQLGEVREACGDSLGALRARFQAIARAHGAGLWLDRERMDPAIVETVMRNVEKLRVGRRERLFQSFEDVREACGSAAVARVEQALLGYLGETDATPPDPRQRPKFLYMPGLPTAPYHDPMLQPWAPQLAAAWHDIRDEATALLTEDRDFESFLGLKPGQNREGYVGGANPNAAWDAYFFYRHGQRFDDHHVRCPITSAVIESIELCRIDRQAPEVCFSVIRPQSAILAHYGVTNTRLVMHLPLIVPGDCALNVVDAGEHHWREGELMMFDDTFQHEAWNRSDEPRLILLMDCWNPHLSQAEQRAVKQLIQAIDEIEN